MKPIDIEIPFDWDNRKIIIHDRVWYVPTLLKTPQEFVFPSWSASQIFGNTNPVIVEYCSGNGAWILEKAKLFPQLNWVAVEMKFQRVRKIWSKVKNNNLPNLFIICGEGLLATKNYFPSCSIADIYINFPDPWPKNRHAKNRIIRPDFLEQAHRILHPRGSITFVTDDFGYSEWTINIFQKDPNFQSAYPPPFYVTERPDYGTSYFENLWREQGKTILYHQFIKK